MKSITLKRINKTQAGKSLFHEGSFSVSARDRVAILGDNGVGKSTLLKIMVGLEAVDEGTVMTDGKTAYLSQQTLLSDYTSISDFLRQTSTPPLALQIIKKFGVVSSSLLEQDNISALSGGQQRVIEIAALLATGAMFICLDEPENHLDIKARHILSELLKSYWGAVIFVSHDQHLIDSVAKTTLTIENEKFILAAHTSYTMLLANQDKRQIRQEQLYRDQAKRVQKMTDTVAELKRQTTLSDAKAKTYQMKKRQLAEEVDLLKDLPRTTQALPRIHLQDVEKKSGKMIVSLDNVAIGYNKTVLFKDVTLNIHFGERVCIIARNGTGKTSLLNVIQRKLLPKQGVVRLGVNMKVASFAQDQLDLMGQTPLEHMISLGYSLSAARAMLSELNFSSAEILMLSTRLSGGQKQRLRLAMLFYQNPDFVILDEPTNNLDQKNWQLLCDLLTIYQGTVLLVTHDQALLQNITKPIFWTINKQQIKVDYRPLATIIDTL